MAKDFAGNAEDPDGLTFLSGAAGASAQGAAMTFASEELEGGITKVVLAGRMDIEGSAAVDLRMNVVAGTAKKLLVDMQDVLFLGSMGLRSLVLPAQAVSRRGGKVVIFAPVKMVEDVLRASNIHAIIPIHHDMAEALAALA
jgi:anti-sigma B factor antagonist